MTDFVTCLQERPGLEFLGDIVDMVPGDPESIDGPRLFQICSGIKTLSKRSLLNEACVDFFNTQLQKKKGGMVCLLSSIRFVSMAFFKSTHFFSLSIDAAEYVSLATQVFVRSVERVRRSILP